jgi:hypothetical protein
MILDPHIVCTAFGTLPADFETQVAGRMEYSREGDNVIIFRSAFAKARPDFHTSPLGEELALFFLAHPEQTYIVLNGSTDESI